MTRESYFLHVHFYPTTSQLRDQHQRIDETPVHVALREALVNSLIHADYNGSTPILIVKEPNQFTFRNPGTLRIPREEVFQGGNSDCRNRNLQKMFQMIGEGEKAGSGFPAILKAWESQSWSDPFLIESPISDYVSLQLKMTSFLPQEALDQLATHFGASFSELDENARLALVLAQQEGFVTNERFRFFTYHHPADITKHLASLVRQGFLLQERGGRWTKYYLASKRELASSPTASLDSVSQIDAVYSTGQLELPYPIQNLIKSEENPINSDTNPIKSEENPINSDTNPIKSEDITEDAGIHSTNSVQSNISDKDWGKLMQVGEPARKGRITSANLAHLIFNLCSEQSLTIQQLAVLLKRNAMGLRSNYITQMVEQGVLVPVFPDKISHPRQAYKAA